MSRGRFADGSTPDGRSLRHKRPVRLLLDELPAYLNSFRPNSRPGCIIFAQGRTGTWLLHSLLNQHPELHFDKEILQPPVLMPKRLVLGEAKSVHPKLYGCHIQIDQLLNTQGIDPAAFLNSFVHKGWRIIHVQRKDVVRQSISAILAVQRSHWVSRNPDAVEQSAMEIDIERVIERIRRRQLHLSMEAQILGSLGHLPLVYENDLQDAASHQWTADRIFDYLDIKSVPVTAGTHRTTPTRLENVIANFEPLMERISREFPEYNVSE